MSAHTLIDEYGDTGILQPCCAEKRRNSRGESLGHKPRDGRSYDERQIQPREPNTDVQGNSIDGA